MIKRVMFRRNTHDKSGNYREECGNEECTRVHNEVRGIGIHALDSKKAMTFSEFVESHRKYTADYPEDSDMPTIPELLEDLAAMLRCGLVVSVQEVLFTQESEHIPDDQVSAD